MSLTAGTRLGPYEVVAPLGAGGMGEVYRARDARLGRDVAIKILPDVVAADPERKARFEREARTLASLNHPNIAGIHGVEDGQGVPALVLELVEGPTLADRLAQGPMPIDEALAAARQIADALEAAHGINVVHRDLKPANVKLRIDGTVKVLDFGLAKAIGAARDGGTDSSGRVRADGLSNSPTITGPIGMTGVGILLGTAAYMPPEQARGKPVDKRADIWAFGCVLYEMLAGKRCFDGEDTSLTLAEVIKSEPDWSALPATTPVAVRSTLKHCLQKDPKRRFHDIADVRLALDGAFAPAAAHDRPLAEGRRWGLPIAAAAGLVVGAMAAGVVLWRPAPAPSAAPVNRFTVTLPAGTNFRENLVVPIALTADGRRLLLNVSTGGTDRVLVRSMDQMQPQPVQGLEGSVGSVFLSPDGEWIGFNDAKGFLKRVRLSGGPAATVTEIGAEPSRTGFQGATWGTGGTIVFAAAPNRALMTVAEAGGLAKPLTTPAENEAHQQPHFLPDGRSLLLTVRRPGQFQQIAYLAAGAATPTILFPGTDPRYLPTGHLLFVRDATVWAVGFDSLNGRTVGDPSPVLEGVDLSGSVGRFAVSADGTLAYVPGGGGGGLRTIVRVDPNGKEETLSGLAPNNFGVVRVSPEGTRLAYEVGRPSDVWVYEFARGTTTRITTTDAVDASPLWTVDGSRLVYSSIRDGRVDLYVRNADGSGAAERVIAGDSRFPRMDADAWAQGAEQLLVTVGRGPGNADISAVSFNADRQLRDILASPSIEAAPAISPDGRWLAYHSNVSGTLEVYVERFPDLGERQRVSTSSGSAPRWSPNSRELFFQSADGRRLFAVPVTLGAKLGVGTAKMLFEGPYVPSGPGVRSFEVMPDGRFLLLKEMSAPEPNSPATVTVVQNWTEELKRLVPGVGRPQ